VTPPYVSLCSRPRGAKQAKVIINDEEYNALSERPKVRMNVLKRIRGRRVVKPTGCEETLFKQAHQAHKHLFFPFNPQHWFLYHMGLY
jgi:hypothetical protein